MKSLIKRRQNLYAPGRAHAFQRGTVVAVTAAALIMMKALDGFRGVGRKSVLSVCKI